MRVNREELLKALEMVSAGLAKREIIEQSQCFVFGGGKVTTFNDEVAVRMDSPLAIEGAVQAAPLVALLRKLPEDALDVEMTEDGLTIKGKGRRSSVRMESEVLLPVEGIEEPGKWRKMPEGLIDALKVGVSCCGKDESHFVLTCVHIAGDRVESSDNYQIVSYPIDTGVKKSMLVRRDSVAKVLGVDPSEWSESDGWLHFRNPAGLVLSCRRYVEDYPEIGKFLDVDGTKAKFPKGIDDALDKAQIFSAEAPEGNQVSVSLSEGRIRIKGQGPSGWYQEQKKVEYDGEPLKFDIDPRLLLEISRKAAECLVGDGRIRVDTGKFVYVACTAVAE
jgi:hypothetical protein